MRERSPSVAVSLSGCLVLAVALAGCFGDGEMQLAGPHGRSPHGSQPDAQSQRQAFTCDPSRTPEEVPLRRLTRRQYVRTVDAWVREAGLPGSEAQAVRGAVQELLPRFPEDRRVGAPGENHGGFSQLDQAVQQAHVDASWEVGHGLARALTSSSARRGALLGTCATDADGGNDGACLRAFIARYGAAVLRRPLSPSDVDFFAQSALSGGTQGPVSPEVVADVLTLLFTSPEALYLVEQAPAEWDLAQGGPAPLDAHALASRLSYHFWQAPPDAALREAAESGALLTPEGYRAQVDRLFEDARTEASLRDFFGQWFRLEDLQPLDSRVGLAAFDAFAGADRPSATLHVEMRQEVEDLVTWLVRSGGNVGDVLSSRKHVARSPAVAALYEQAPWDGVGEPPELLQTTRSGLLTRAAFLASASGNTRPVMKGYHVRNALLCQVIPPPPDNAMAMPVEPSEEATTRERVAQLTEQPGSSCAGCHTGLLNPLGYVTEGFDALGRARTHERLFAEDGQMRRERAVDTRAKVSVGAVQKDALDALDATETLAQSGVFESCFARQYFRFAFGRAEREAQDGCALAALEAAAQEGRPMAEVLKEVALQPAFQRRDYR